MMVVGEAGMNKSMQPEWPGVCGPPTWFIAHGLGIRVQVVGVGEHLVREMG